MNEQQPPQPKSKVARTVKRVVLTIATAGLWVLMLYYLQLAIELRDYGYWIVPTLLILLVLPVIALAAISMPRKMFMLVGLGLSLTYLLFFPLNLAAILSILILFFGFWRAFHRAQFESQNHVRFAPNQIVKKVSSMMILVLLITISINVYQNIANDIRQDEAAFYSRLAKGVTKGVLPVVERQLDGFNPQQTLDEFIVRGFTENSPEFRNLPPDLREEQIAASRKSIADQFGIAATGREPLSDITERAVEAQISELVSQRNKWLVPIIYSLAIFSLLRILAFVGQLIAQAWGIFLFWLMRKTEFIKVAVTQIPAEKVEI